VNPDGPLPRYNWLESYCRLLVQHIASGAFAEEVFEVCAPLIGGRFAIVTARHLLVVTPTHVHETREAEVTLVVPVDSVLHASSTGAYLEVTHLSPATLAECALSATAAILTHMPGSGSSPIPPFPTAFAGLDAGRPTQQGITAAAHQGKEAAGQQAPAKQQLQQPAEGASMAAIPPTEAVRSHAAPAGKSPPRPSGLFDWLMHWGRGQEVALKASRTTEVEVQGSQHDPASSVSMPSGSVSAQTGASSSAGNDASYVTGGGAAVLGLPQVPAASQPHRVSASSARGSPHLGVAQTLSGSSVAGWFGITRLQVMDAEAAAGMANCLQGLVRAYEQHSCLGSSLLMGFDCP
jgi:hypothetical protein